METSLSNVVSRKLGRIAVMSAVAIPALQGGLRIDRLAVNVDLEVEVAANRDRVAGLPHRAHQLTGVDAVRRCERGPDAACEHRNRSGPRLRHESASNCRRGPVVTSPQNLAIAHRHQGSAASGDDVEALVGATAVSRGAEFADRAAGAVRALDGEDVAVVGGATISKCNPRRGRRGRNCSEEKKR